MQADTATWVAETSCFSILMAPYDRCLHNTLQSASMHTCCPRLQPTCPMCAQMQNMCRVGQPMHLHAWHSAADVRALSCYDKSAAQQVAHVRLQRTTHVSVQVWRDSWDAMVRCNAPCLQAGRESESSRPSHRHRKARVQIWLVCENIMLRRYGPRLQTPASVMRCMPCTFALQFAPAARMRATMPAPCSQVEHPQA